MSIRKGAFETIRKIAEAAASPFPEDKMESIRHEQQAGKLVAMMGDGTNNAQALA